MKILFSLVRMIQFGPNMLVFIEDTYTLGLLAKTCDSTSIFSQASLEANFSTVKSFAININE